MEVKSDQVLNLDKDIESNEEEVENTYKKFEENYINTDDTNGTKEINKGEKEGSKVSNIGLRPDQLFNKTPNRGTGENDLSYKTRCDNTKNFGGYNRAERRNMKKKMKIKRNADVNYVAALVRQQNDKIKEEKEKNLKASEKSEKSNLKYNPRINMERLNKKWGISSKKPISPFSGLGDIGTPEIISMDIDEKKLMDQENDK